MKGKRCCWIVALVVVNPGCQLAHLATQNLTYEMALSHEGYDYPEWPSLDLPPPGACEHPHAPAGPVPQATGEPTQWTHPEPGGVQELPSPGKAGPASEHWRRAAELAPPPEAHSAPPADPTFAISPPAGRDVGGFSSGPFPPPAPTWRSPRQQ
jgi:hypothetical protein